MKNLSFLLAASALAIGVSACSSTDIAENKRSRSARLDSISAHKAGSSELSADLTVMTGAERERYHRLTTDWERTRFLDTNGISVRREMHQRLAVDMDKDGVMAAMKGLYDSHEAAPAHSDRFYFSVFNGMSRTHMYCVFERTLAEDGTFNFALKTWGSYTDEQMDENRHLAFLEADLKRKLDRWLRVGMGDKEILTTLADASRLRNNLISQSTNEIRESSDDKALTALNSVETPSAGIGSDIWRLNAMLDFFDGLTAEPDYVIRQSEIEYWYHTIPVKGSKRFIVVEYRFVNRALERWFVYDKDFLGFLDHK